jgi:hypothetical protein
MKRLLTICLIFSALFVSGQTSIYKPFPDNNAVWNFHYSSFCFWDGNGDEKYSITFSGDTLINSQQYHKLTTPYVQSYSTGTCGRVAIGYKGAIRQDISAKKVYYIPPSASTEQLLYDFTMQVGDTVKGYTQTYALPFDIVQSIDSVEIGSSYRKRWNINNCYNIQFIEGIGSTYGLLELSVGCITDQADYSLTCFQQNGLALYPNTTDQCELITSVNSLNKISNQIIIYPNPSNGSFTINFNKADNKEILITDLLGNTILKQLIRNQTKINISQLKSGTYILTVIDNDSITISRKIISCP